nr:aminoglycoside adenylyltransferase domain-containing protein [Paenibacillus sp. MSJ-34]
MPKDAKEIYETEGYKEVIPTAEPQAWPDCDEDIKRFVEKLIERLKHALGDRLAGIYLHGSLAMGSYYRPKSDIDLIVVVKDQLEAELAGTVAAAIANESVHRPTVGNVELSVITAETAGHIPVPTPFEVHYSSSWHDRILQNEVDYGSERTDSDILCHVTYVVQRGICLYGQPIPAVFGQVEWHDFMKAVLDDLEWILEDEHILETPYYSVLNICRVFQLISENSQQVHSKDEGGEWGLKHFPNEYRQLIRQALDIYRSSEEVTEELRKTGGKEWDREKLLSFRNYARSLLQDS